MQWSISPIFLLITSCFFSFFFVELCWRYNWNRRLSKSEAGKSSARSQHDQFQFIFSRSPYKVFSHCFLVKIETNWLMLLWLEATLKCNAIQNHRARNKGGRNEMQRELITSNYVRPPQQTSIADDDNVLRQRNLIRLTYIG